VRLKALNLFITKHYSSRWSGAAIDAAKKAIFQASALNHGYGASFYLVQFPSSLTMVWRSHRCGKKGHIAKDCGKQSWWVSLLRHPLLNSRNFALVWFFSS
jgi:hypothetical protein